MRRRLLAAAVTPSLALSLGCVAFTDTRGPIVLDYEIDRVLVPAIRLDPPAPVQGQPVRVDALVLAPRAIDGVTAETCGLAGDLPVTIGIDCFDNEALVAPLGTSLPLDWDVPVVGEDCLRDTSDADTASSPFECASRVPLRVTATSGEDQGAGAIWLDLLRAAPAEVRSIHDAERTLFYEGYAARGEDLALIYRIDWDGPIDFRWYVDAGELHHTGRTATTWLQGTEHTTRNQLAIPTGYVGPLRVVVVAVAEGGITSGNVTWDVLTLEVQ